MTTVATEQSPRTVAPDNVLWTTDDIAAYLQFSVPHVRDRIVHLPGFPKPLRIGGARRWAPADIKEWAEG